MLQRFININISEHFVNLSIDTWSSLKEKASSSISKAMRNKNIVNILIEARKILIPLRRDDYKNSELMCLDLGRLFLENTQGDEIYSKKYLVRNLSCNILVK